MTVQFRNLVFEGGGVKGIAYIGAMKQFTDSGYFEHIIRVAGTSAGSINALIYALGFSTEEQRQILFSTDFKKFMDDSWGIIRDVSRLATKYGWYKGNNIQNWIGNLVAQKLGSKKATFGDLKRAGKPDLYVIASNLSTQYSEVFSHERHSDMPLSDAIRMSMSIPLFFQAVRNGKQNDLYVDGGVQLNYPVKLFDRLKYIDMDNEPNAYKDTPYYEKENEKFAMLMPGRSPYVYNKQTLGMRLDTKEEIAVFRYNESPKGVPINSFTDYAKALLGAILSVQENQHLHTDDWHRTVYIDTLDVKTTDFSLSEEKKLALLSSGRDCADKYIEWFEDIGHKEPAVNRC